MKSILLSFPVFISKSTRNITDNALGFNRNSGFSSCSKNENAMNCIGLRVISNNSKEDDFFDYEKDESDSVAEFQLIPQFGDIEVGNFHADKLEEKVDDEPTQGNLKKLTYNIVFVTSEASPYSKTGGLGDVCGSLPIALAARGHRVMVLSPRYLYGGEKFAGTTNLDCTTKVNCFGGVQEVGFFHEYRKGVDWMFVDHPCYHCPGNPYGDIYGAFGDNQFRFTLLCHAACEAPLVLPLGGFTYGQTCLFLANDWHAGLVPVLLAAKYRPNGIYKDARSIIVIHNLAHQGVEPASTYWLFLGNNNPRMSSRKFVMNGITNGIDVTEWDPSSDEHISSHYTADDLSGKIECKIALQKELGLPPRPDCPLIGFIGRLDYQKGIDIILSAAPALLQDDVMLGSGEKQYEEWMRVTEAAFNNKFRGWVGFNVPISHQITAGYEPCGLNQLYAMRYGTVPVVHGTGGLRMGILTVDKRTHVGCKLYPNSKRVSQALRVAIKIYREHKTSWEGLMRRGMERDCSWDNVAGQYEQVFQWVFMDPPYIT
ncbi:hypothetical protein L1987_24728 [Smallanthus sonchifolius]|uniref:Uncharacterized protein n=1 Tax=Smallanthus sonchifolius TaxID=185202 RepID=A0ACB9INW7_9ASTR|nr:hypothetical protein L1987_24728 [Smallanthus sonchifolius]